MCVCAQRFRIEMQKTDVIPRPLVCMASLLNYGDLAKTENFGKANFKTKLTDFLLRSNGIVQH